LYRIGLAFSPDLEATISIRNLDAKNLGRGNILLPCLRAAWSVSKIVSQVFLRHGGRLKDLAKAVFKNLRTGFSGGW
jgi:hypothetical protein